MSDTLHHQKIQQQPIILHYYPIRGVTQPIRNLLNYLQIDYLDNYLQKNQENQMETGFRVGLPMLQDGNFKINQQISIMNYLCMKANKQSLLGLTPQDGGKINELLFKYSVQKKKIMSSIMEGLKYLDDHTLSKKELTEKIFKKIVEENRFIEVCLKKFAKNKKYIFEYPTVIDFLFYEICFYIEGFYKQLVQKDSQYYGLVRFKNVFQKQQFFVKNKQKLQKSLLFFEFNTPTLNAMVSKLWKGTDSEHIFVKNEMVKV